MTTVLVKPAAPSLHSYLALCKPRVVALMLLTTVVGMMLAAEQAIPLRVLGCGTMGIGLLAAAGAAVNHVLDRQFDIIMRRTHARPIPAGELTPAQALLFASILAITGMTVLLLWVNSLTAVLSLLTFFGYAVVYTVFLKHATPQNIVIGGAAGAAPPLLGWTAVTGHVAAEPLLLMLIIFAWTPPHFWALAVHRKAEYAKANIPMLPVTHGSRYTQWHILLYTLLLLAVSLLPFAIAAAGWIYLFSALALGLGFCYWAIVLLSGTKPNAAIRTFQYSIIYLMLLFLALVFDHYYLRF